ncbi:Rne/Rng family ribonuclease [Desulfitibacter alkalitolerans]|uniref:Rne/Rng family ribonuclease n=1 Tax=Desulfitibacter alkalitolerans TaxID=264641 RepID=UPI000480C4DF|nr:Rne/Rng family ribonuclease [Desulfitibacter alkalitolerans]
MQKELMVDVQEEQILVTIVEDGILMEVYVEREFNKRIVGNIYLGVVKNVLPGMQAAFVDIGLERNAFLFVEDAVPSKNMLDDSFKGPQISICDVLREGQQILVQVSKEPVGSKGARVTTNITIPGRYTVLMPYVEYVGVSRRIESEEERDRLKKIASRVKSKSMGMIVRTVAEGAGEKELEADLQNLQAIWGKIEKRLTRTAAPRVIYKDLGLTQRMVRDLLDEKVSRIIVNCPEVKEQILEAMTLLDCQHKYRVVYEEGDILERYSILSQLDQAFNKRVWLKSGAYIVIDQTEALTAIDINTGKYIGKDDLQSTVLNTNLQATAEIARQLRLRNIGGIIIIDFIDMEKPEHKQLVIDSLERELKNDKTKTNIMGITSLGLVEMTRKKARMGLESLMLNDCPYCEGKGKLLSIETIALRTKKRIRNMAGRTLQAALLIRANPIVASQIIGSNGVSLKRLEESTGKTIVVKGDESFHIEHVEVRSISDKEMEAYLPVKEGDVIDIKVEEPQSGDGKDGIARLNGYVISIINGSPFVGQEVTVKIIKAYRTYARGEII